MYSFIQIIKR